MTAEAMVRGRQPPHGQVLGEQGRLEQDPAQEHRRRRRSRRQQPPGPAGPPVEVPVGGQQAEQAPEEEGVGPGVEGVVDAVEHGGVEVVAVVDEPQPVGRRGQHPDDGEAVGQAPPAGGHRGHHGERPQDVELLLHRERPGLGQVAEERGVAEGLAVVGVVEERGEAVPPQPVGGVGHVHEVGVDGQQAHGQQQRRHQADPAAGVEGAEADPAVALAFAGQHGGDQEPRQHEEHLERHPGAGQGLEVRVVGEDGEQGQGPDAGQRGPVARGGSGRARARARWPSSVSAAAVGDVGARPRPPWRRRSCRPRRPSPGYLVPAGPGGPGAAPGPGSSTTCPHRQDGTPGSTGDHRCRPVPTGVVVAASPPARTPRTPAGGVAPLPSPPSHTRGTPWSRPGRHRVVPTPCRSPHPGGWPAGASGPGGRVLVPLAIVLIGAWTYRWVDEDAFINFRIVHNLLAGHGPVFNVGERVEVSSDPLWLFTLAVLHGVLPGLARVDLGRPRPGLHGRRLRGRRHGRGPARGAPRRGHRPPARPADGVGGRRGVGVRHLRPRDVDGLPVAGGHLPPAGPGGGAADGRGAGRRRGRPRHPDPSRAGPGLRGVRWPRWSPWWRRRGGPWPAAGCDGARPWWPPRWPCRWPTSCSAWPTSPCSSPRRPWPRRRRRRGGPRGPPTCGTSWRRTRCGCPSAWPRWWSASAWSRGGGRRPARGAGAVHPARRRPGRPRSTWSRSGATTCTPACCCPPSSPWPSRCSSASGHCGPSSWCRRWASPRGRVVCLGWLRFVRRPSPGSPPRPSSSPTSATAGSAPPATPTR